MNGTRVSIYKVISTAAAAAAKLFQSCPTLCDPIDGSPPGSPVPGILQTRTLEWVAISFSNAGKWKMKVKSLSRVWLLATPWTTAYQAPLSMGFSRQQYWNGFPFPSLFFLLHIAGRHYRLSHQGKAFPGGSAGNESTCNVGDLGFIPGVTKSRTGLSDWTELNWEDPLEKGKATHSSILAWRIWWTV